MIDNWMIAMIDNWMIAMIDNWMIAMIDNWMIAMVTHCRLLVYGTNHDLEKINPYKSQQIILIFFVY